MALLTQARGCEGKKHYVRAAARAQAKRRNKRRGDVWLAYGCPWCDDGTWHVGHHPGNPRG